MVVTIPFSRGQTIDSFMNTLEERLPSRGAVINMHTSPGKEELYVEVVETSHEAVWQVVRAHRLEILEALRRQGSASLDLLRTLEVLRDS